MHMQLQYILLLLFINLCMYFACIYAVYFTFLNANPNIVLYAICDQNFLREGEGGKTRS